MTKTKKPSLAPKQAAENKNVGNLTDDQQKVFDGMTKVVDGQLTNNVCAPLFMILTGLFNSLEPSDKQLFCLDLMKQIGAFASLIPMVNKGQKLELKLKAEKANDSE